MNGKPGPPRILPIVIRDGETLRVIPANVSPITIRTRACKARRVEAGRCRDCGKVRKPPKHRTEPFKLRCPGCQQRANAAVRRLRRRRARARAEATRRGPAPSRASDR